MSQTRQVADQDVLVRFWSLDHHRAEEVLWPTSPWQKLVFAVEGTLHVTTERELHVLPSNRALWVEAHEAHPARTLGKARVRTLFFSPEVQVRREQRVLEVRPLFRELIAETCRIGPLLGSRGYDAALAVLLRQEIEAAERLPTSIPMPTTDWLRAWALAFLADPLRAYPEAYSRSTVERRMRRETGLSLGRWCQQARALVGLQALSRGLSVTEASVEAGFETCSGFVQSCRRQLGATPGQILSRARD